MRISIVDEPYWRTTVAPETRTLVSAVCCDGKATKILLPSDYDGDGKVDLSVKTSDGRWLIDYTSNGFGFWDAELHGYGGAYAHPVPADYDGDAKADLSVKVDDGRWL